jgi:integrase
MGYVFQRGGVWYIKYRDAAGKRKRVATKASGVTAARKLLVESEAKAERIRLGLDVAPPSEKLFSDLVDKYQREVSSQKGSPETDKARIENHLLPGLGNLYLRDVSDALPTFIANLKVKRGKQEAHGASQQTKKHIWGLVRTIFNWAMEKDPPLWVGRNPAATMDAPEVPESAPRAFELDVLPKILGGAEGQDRWILALGIYTALRKGEVLGLKKTDVNLQARTILIERSHGKSTTKGKRYRVVPIHPELVSHLTDALNASGSVWLFPDEEGGRRSHYTKTEDILRRAMKRAGVVEGWDHKCRRRSCKHVIRRPDDARTFCPKCRKTMEAIPVTPDWQFKDLRSTWATHAAEQTGDIVYVQRVLGHRDPRVTEEKYFRRRVGYLVDRTDTLKLGFGPRKSGHKTAPKSLSHGRDRSEWSSQATEDAEVLEARDTGIEPVTFGSGGRRNNGVTSAHEVKPEQSRHILSPPKLEGDMSKPGPYSGVGPKSAPTVHLISPLAEQVLIGILAGLGGAR